MPIKLSQFGPVVTSNTNSLDLKRGIVNPVPQAADTRIVQLGLSSGIQAIGSQVRSTYEPVQNAVYQALQATKQLNQLPMDVLTQINRAKIDAANTLGAVGQIVGSFSSEAGGLFTMWSDNLKGAQTKRNYNFRKDTGAKASEKSYPGPTSSQDYGLPRIAWQLTTELRRARSQPPIYFFVNPDTISYSQAYVEALDMIQKGYFLTQWRDAKTKNNFPSLKLGFNFQSSNLLPESYLDRITPNSNLSTPPGLQNWYDLNELFSEEKILDRDSLEKDGVSTEIAKEFDGLPNYVYLSISTRVYPRMTLKGFFTAEINFSENAQDPLKFSVPLNFIAFDSDPHWYDMNELKTAYTNFWNSVWGATKQKILEEFAKAAPLPTSLAPISDVTLNNVFSNTPTVSVEAAPPPIPPENEPEKLSPDLSTKDNNTILTGDLPGNVTQEKVLGDGSKLTKTVDDTDKYVKLEKDTKETKKEVITKASETGTSFQSAKDVDKASGSTTVDVTTEKEGNVVTQKILNVQVTYKDPVPPPWLPWGQYPPIAELMAMFPNIMDDEMFARRQYDAARRLAAAELKQKVGQ